MRKNKWTMAAAALVVVSTVASAWAGERTTRPTTKDTASFRVASSTAVSGFTAQKTRSGETVYVAPSDTFTIADVVEFQTPRSRSGDQVKIMLQPGVTERLAAASAGGSMNRLAILRGGRLVDVSTIESIGVNQAVVSGMAPTEVTRLARLVAGPGLAGDTSTTVTIVPRRDSASAGGTVTVDVFVSNVPKLRTYQFALDTSGGTSGTLTRTDGVVDQTRSDFVFGTDQVIQAVDKIHGRFGAVLFNGGKDVKGQSYVGTYNFQASPDAKGAFTISVNPTRMSFMSDASGNNIPFRSTPITVTLR